MWVGPYVLFVAWIYRWGQFLTSGLPSQSRFITFPCETSRILKQKVESKKEKEIIYCLCKSRNMSATTTTKLEDEKRSKKRSSSPEACPQKGSVEPTGLIARQRNELHSITFDADPLSLHSGQMSAPELSGALPLSPAEESSVQSSGHSSVDELSPTLGSQSGSVDFDQELTDFIHMDDLASAVHAEAVLTGATPAAIVSPNSIPQRTASAANVPPSRSATEVVLRRRKVGAKEREHRSMIDTHANSFESMASLQRRRLVPLTPEQLERRCLCRMVRSGCGECQNRITNPSEGEFSLPKWGVSDWGYYWWILGVQAMCGNVIGVLIVLLIPLYLAQQLFKSSVWRFLHCTFGVGPHYVCKNPEMQEKERLIALTKQSFQLSALSKSDRCSSENIYIRTYIWMG